MGFIHHYLIFRNQRQRRFGAVLKHSTRRWSMAALAGLFMLSMTISLFNQSKPVNARDFDAEIKALQNQINDYKKKSGELAEQSNTLKGKIAELQNRQAEIQTQIDLSSAKKSKLEKDIADAEAKIKSQAKALSQNLQNQYYNSKVSSLDILMNSSSVSDYVDRQSRQESVKEQISESVKTIKETKAQLEKDKAEVETIIKRQNSQKAELERSKAEQQQLLDETQGQESKFKELTASTEAKKAQVQREQQAAIARYRASMGNASGTIISNSQCGGGYPFCNLTPDSSARSGGFVSYGNVRECVNYVQWRIFQLTGRNELHGNAGSWASVANSGAKAGTVAIIGYGSLPYGHVAWVEEVGTGSRSGQVYISEYNWSPYSYTERWVPISSFTGGFYDPLQ